MFKCLAGIPNVALLVLPMVHVRRHEQSYKKLLWYIKYIEIVIEGTEILG